MKITKGRLAEIVGQEMRRAERVTKFQVREASTELEQSHRDLAVKVSSAASVLDDIMIDYVDSGWLERQDQASLAKNLEEAFTLIDQLRNTFSTLASSSVSVGEEESGP
jgi:hypothetical protein